MTAGLLLGWMGLLGAAGCGGGEAASATKVTAPELPVIRDGVVEVPAGYAERVGITVAPAHYEDVTPIVHVTGVLEFDAQRLAAVGSRIAGRVADVEVIEGSKVEVGQVLGTLVSAEARHGAGRHRGDGGPAAGGQPRRSSASAACWPRASRRSASWTWRSRRPRSRRRSCGRRSSGWPPSPARRPRASSGSTR
ncbi:hypothetical protein [Nannocystis pusilla]|uniref:hypothetical protein n=1 Tax=Nannocystis pusilla TaxID=889268 RepID=UPI003DA54C20